MTWIPVWALPNISLDEPVNGEWIALAPVSDPRVQGLMVSHRNFRTFMGRFRNSHGDPIEPALIIRKGEAPEGVATREAIASFRDAVVAATVPWARTLNVVNQSCPGLVAYSNFFWVNPWMIDRHYQYMVALTPAIGALHDVDALHGQSSPEVSPTGLLRQNLDEPMLQELLRRWEARFGTSQPTWKDLALFRSLNMANQACLIPGGQDVVMYDFGRITGLWIAAFEILVHPGGNGKANKLKVFELLEGIPWMDRTCGHRRFLVWGQRARVRKNLACWLYEQIYKCRNNFFHGNQVNRRSLLLPKSNRFMAEHAATLYRLTLSAFLDLTWKEPLPMGDDLKKDVEYAARRSDFERRQGIHEKALRLSRISVVQQQEERQQWIDAARARQPIIRQAIADAAAGEA